MNITYKTKGAAAEYAYYGLNLTRGCVLGCKYCYAAQTPWMTADAYCSGPQIKDNVIERVCKDACNLRAAGDKRLIQLSFVGDPCQTPEVVELTREVLKILGEHELNATILTKSGMAAEPLFETLQRYGFSFGTSLVWCFDSTREKWEPDAASIDSRFEAMLAAKAVYELKTWVSLEPVVDPDEALAVISDQHRIIDHWKVGKINHMPELEKAVDWYKFYADVTELLDSVGADYYIKESLKKFEVKI